MEISEIKDFLYRVLSINLNEYLEDLGFIGTKVEEDITAFTSEAHPDTIIVDHQDNTWVSLAKLDGHKSIVDLGAEYYQCSKLEFLDWVQLDPHLPDQHSLHQEFEERQTPYHLISEPGPIHSEAVQSLFESLNIPKDCVNRYCHEFQLILGDDPMAYTALVLKNQPDFNHLLLIQKLDSAQHMERVPNDEVGTLYKADEVFRKVDFHFIDRQTNNIDVFQSIADLLARQYEYDRIGIQAPSQLLLSTPYAFEMARPVMERHENINLFLPNTLLCDLHKLYGNWLSPKYKDFSTLYKEYPCLAFSQAILQDTGQLHRKQGRGL